MKSREKKADWQRHWDSRNYQEVSSLGFFFLFSSPIYPNLDSRETHNQKNQEAQTKTPRNTCSLQPKNCEKGSFPGWYPFDHALLILREHHKRSHVPLPPQMALKPQRLWSETLTTIQLCTCIQAVYIPLHIQLCGSGIWSRALLTISKLHLPDYKKSHADHPLSCTKQMLTKR